MLIREDNRIDSAKMNVLNTKTLNCSLLIEVYIGYTGYLANLNYYLTSLNFELHKKASNNSLLGK